VSDSLPPDFSEALARTAGQLRRLGQPLLFFRTLASTNDVAAALAQAGHREGAIVLADAQTAGRGRRGRSWFSASGSGLFVSVLLEPGSAPESPDRATALLTLAAGVALSEAIETSTGLRTEIKWPNDLLVGRRKLAGILAEGVTTGASNSLELVVLGYGVNVGAATYPPDLRDRATSIEEELGRAVDRAVLFAETVVALERRYDDLMHARFDAILDRWRDRAPASRGARVSWQTASGPRTGITCGLDERGALLVRSGTITERIVAGEVTWI